MREEQSMVDEFHRKFDIHVEPSPSIPDEATRRLRIRLIQEEFDELKEALAQEDLIGIAKELADVLYVVYGTAVSCGIDMEPIFREVHRSNLSKVGGYKRADGKWVKPAGYSPAQLAPILSSQTTGACRAAEAHLSDMQDVE
jgi:predicted HAD superfamily Cof-like phosphohydrolase